MVESGIKHNSSNSIFSFSVHVPMWYAMESEQNLYALSERLIRAISNWHHCVPTVDDIEDLIEAGADVNRLHGTLLPLHCACMVSDSDTLKLLLEKGAKVYSTKLASIGCFSALN